MAAEASAVLSLQEKNSIRHHLGYGSQLNVQTIALGVPSASQTLFLVEGAMDRIPQSAVGRIRATVGRLDAIEEALAGIWKQLRVDQVGTTKLRSDAGDALEREYTRWSDRLANDLMVPKNPYAERYQDGRRPLNRPVIQS